MRPLQGNVTRPPVLNADEPANVLSAKRKIGRFEHHD